MGDWIVEGQYRLHDFQQGQWLPAISLESGETISHGPVRAAPPFQRTIGRGAIPRRWGSTRKCHRDGDRRLLRAEFNLSYTFYSRVGISGHEVYGTPDGFFGAWRSPDRPSLAISRWETVFGAWSAATETSLSWDNPTQVAGTDVSGAPLQASSGWAMFYIHTVSGV